MRSGAGRLVRQWAHSCKDDFRGAVDDCLALCRKVGKHPDKPFSGTFNARVGPELHAA
ncbi:MAG: toxin-antitoxin system HicB family antitoxin [Lentisphaeria bacterium]